MGGGRMDGRGVGVQVEKAGRRGGWACGAGGEGACGAGGKGGWAGGECGQVVRVGRRGRMGGYTGGEGGPAGWEGGPAGRERGKAERVGGQVGRLTGRNSEGRPARVSQQPVSRQCNLKVQVGISAQVVPNPSSSACSL